MLVQVDVQPLYGELAHNRGGAMDANGTERSRVVLLVDDDALWLRGCEQGFSGMGCAVSTATNSADALALASQQPPDLVVAEIKIRGESGLELIDAIRRAHPSSAIAIVSAYLSVATTAAAVRRGANLVLFKPVHPSEIVRQLAHADVASYTWVTPTLARAEWEHINRVLMDCNGNVSEAARRLGILRQSLQRRLRKHAPSH
jgi:two-component system, response regulator RegA